MTGPVTFLARGLLAGVFINGGISQVKGARLLAPKVDAAKEEYGVVTEVAGEDLVRLNGAGMALAGGALALGVAPRLSAAALVSMLIPTTVVGHPSGRSRTRPSGAQRSRGPSATPPSSAACCSWRPGAGADPVSRRPAVALRRVAATCSKKTRGRCGPGPCRSG